RSFIVAGTDTKGVGGIYRIDAQTGETTPVVQVAQGDGTYLIQQVTWSRDGKSIYYVVRAKNDRVLVHDLENGQEREIFNAEAMVRGLALSSDGRQLVFFPTYPGTERARVIKIISISGETVREIGLDNVPLVEAFSTIAWTPDGHYLVVGTPATTLNQKSEVWRVPVEGGPFQKVGISMDGLDELRMNPDGKRIAFTAGEFKSEVWVLEHFLTSEPNTVAKRRLGHRGP